MKFFSQKSGKVYVYSILFLNVQSVVHAIELSEVTVQSSKMETTLLDTPYSVDYTDKEQIETEQINTIKDFSAVIPNVNISGVGHRTDATFTVRGISNYVAYESSVAMYVDDVPIPFSYGYGMVDVASIASMEFIKGPQGTLFGKGAESGVINIYTKAPTQELSVDASAGYASYNSYELYGSVSDSIGQSDFSYLLSLSNSHSDGFTTNNFNGQKFDPTNQTALLAKIQYKPSQQLKATLTYSKNNVYDGGSPVKVNTMSDPYQVDIPYDDKNNGETDLLSLVAKFRQGSHQLTSATSYGAQKVNNSNYYAIDTIGLNLVIDLNINIETLTQELRYNYFGENFQVLAGLYYADTFRFNYDDKNTIYMTPAFRQWDIQNPDTNYAAFGQVEYFFTDEFSIIAGLRQQVTQRSYKGDFVMFDTQTGHSDASTTWQHTLPTLRANYLLDDALLYIGYTQGYRPGGYSYRSTEANPEPYKAETTNAFEAGYKQAFLDSFYFTGALFYNLIKDMRVNTFDDTLGSIVLNADRAYAYGSELTLNYKTKQTLADLSFGYTKAKYQFFGQYSGNNVIDSPDMTAALDVRQMFDFGGFVQGSGKFMGKRYYNVENSASLSNYTVINAGIGYENSGMKALLYVDNLFNETYSDFMVYTPSNDYYHIGNPRFIGVKLSYAL